MGRVELVLVFAGMTMSGVVSQSCDAELRAYEACREEQRPGVQFGADDWSQCFSKSGCTDPGQAREAAVACTARAIQRTLAGPLRSCLARQRIPFPPDLVDSLARRGTRHHGRSWESEETGERREQGRGGNSRRGASIGGRSPVDDLVERACTSVRARAAAKACLEKARTNDRRSPKDREQKTRCDALLSARCSDERDRRQDAVCDCGEELSSNSQLMGRLGTAVLACQNPEDAREANSQEQAENAVKGLCKRKRGSRNDAGEDDDDDDDGRDWARAEGQRGNRGPNRGRPNDRGGARRFGQDPRPGGGRQGRGD